MYFEGVRLISASMVLTVDFAAVSTAVEEDTSRLRPSVVDLVVEDPHVVATLGCDDTWSDADGILNLDNNADPQTWVEKAIATVLLHFNERSIEVWRQRRSSKR